MASPSSEKVTVAHHALPRWIGAVALCLVLGIDAYMGARILNHAFTAGYATALAFACAVQVTIILAVVSPTRLVFDLATGTLDVVHPSAPWYLPIQRHRFDLKQVRDVTVRAAGDRAGLALVVDGEERPVPIGALTTFKGPNEEAARQAREVLARHCGR